MAFEIEIGIPLPPDRRGRPSATGVSAALRALTEAPVGASVFFTRPEGKTARRHTSAIGRAAQDVGGKGWAALRTTDDGVRVWKLADATGGRPRQSKIVA